MSASLDLHLSQNKLVLKKYEKLNSFEKIRACYIWIDGSGINMRSKTRTLDFVPTKPEDLPIWDFDGSSTQQSEVAESDVYLYPRAIYRDPFRPYGENKLVLCEALDHNKKPAKGNNRQFCLDQINRVKEQKPWFGFEQEYVLIGKDDRPYGWPSNGEPYPQGPYYCSVGYGKAYCRDVSEALYNALLYSGVSIYGDNAEVLPSQWEYQIGTCEGIDGPDQLWISRYILNRVAEDFDIKITFCPKPVKGKWNGTGCHTNVSLLSTRKPGGLDAIYEAIKKLEVRHQDHLNVYDLNQGKDNVARLSGMCETSNYKKFTYSVSGRSSSVRIPRMVNKDGCGYFEDRRPSGDCDPYLVAGEILKTICD